MTYGNGAWNQRFSQTVLFRSGDSENKVINLYPEITYQTFEGFGGAITEAAGTTYNLMDQSQKQALIEAYFGKERMSYQFIRLPIDSCDFSLEQYTPITANGCTPISSDDDLNGKVVVIRPDILRREYRRATNQVMLCDGGFGASPNSRGSACYCVNLYTGKTSRFERRDILGVLKDDQIPKWAQHGLKYHQAERQRKAQRPPER